jgi:hypothetical protein
MMPLVVEAADTGAVPRALLDIFEITAIIMAVAVAGRVTAAAV